MFTDAVGRVWTGTKGRVRRNVFTEFLSRCNDRALIPRNWVIVNCLQHKNRPKKK